MSCPQGGSRVTGRVGDAFVDLLARLMSYLLSAAVTWRSLLDILS